MMWCLAGSYFSSLTPRTMRDVRPLGRRGDDDLLRARGDVLGGAVAVGEEPGRLEHDVDAEVLPRQLRRIAHRQHLELVAVDGDRRRPSLRPSACRLPSTESYFSRCASVAAFVRSLTATKSMSLSPIAARMMLRPMRPNPLMPTFTAIAPPPASCYDDRLRSDKGNDCSERVAEGQTARYTFRIRRPGFRTYVSPLQPADARWSLSSSRRTSSTRRSATRNTSAACGSGWATCRCRSISTARSRSGSTPCRSARC